ncbi:MAG: autotransporter-associated beta strand repeat-containing protein [Verrucomicrobiota bacterium]
MKLRHLSAAFASLILAAGPASPANVYWQGGTGTWTTTTSQWGSAAAGPFSSSWNNANNDTAIFGGVGGAATVTIGTGMTVGGLQMNANPDGYLYTLSGAQTLTLNSPATITNTSAVTIGNNTATVLAGSAGLTKSGVGTLTLNSSAVNTWTGGLTLNGGTLAEDFSNMGATANLINSGNALTFGGGALTIKSNASNSSSQTFGGVTVNPLGGSILVNPNTKTPTVALGNITATTAGGSLLLGVTGAGPILTATSNKDATSIYGGRVVYFNGTANTGYDWASTASSSSPYTLGAYASYTAMPLTGGNATDNDSTAAGGTLSGSVSASTLKITGSATALALGANTLALTSGGLLSIGSTGQTISGTAGATRLTAGTSGTSDLIVHQYNSGGLTISAVIGNNAGSGTVNLVKAGTQPLYLSGVNTYSGNTYVNSGILDFGTTTPAGSGHNINVAAGASVKFTALNNTLLNRLVSTTDEITIMMADGNTNAIDFSGANGGTYFPNAFLGNYVGNGGKTQYGVASGLTPADGIYRLGSLSSSVSPLGMNIVLADGASPRSLIVGASVVHLTGTNTFSGDTVIRSGGTLVLENPLALQNSAWNTGDTNGANTGSLGLNNAAGFMTGGVNVTSPTFGGLKGSRDLTTAFTFANGFNGDNRQAQASITGLTLNPGTGSTCTYSGIIADLASGTTLTKTGAGSQILAGTNTYSGLTTISGGTLEVGGAGLLGAGNYGANIQNSGTFRYNSTAPQTISGVINGSGGILNKDNTGKLTLTNVNNYSGATTISAGALVGVAGGSCANSDVTLSPTTSATLGVLVNDNTKQWTSQSLTTAGTGPTLDFGFTVAPSSSVAPLNVAGNLTFTTTPALTLDAANLVAGTYPLIVVGGSAPTAVPTVTISGDASAIGSLSVGTVSWGGPGNKTLFVTLSGTATSPSPYPLTWNTSTTGTWDINSTGAWKNNLGTSGVTFTEQVALGGSAVQFLDAGMTADTTVSINSYVSPASITVTDSSYNYIFNGTGSIVGSGSLTKSGIKTLTLSTANSYSGGTYLNAGQITFGNASAFGTGKISVGGNSTLGQTAAFTIPNALEVASGSTLAMSGITSTFNGVLSGSGTISGFGYTLANTANSFTGKLAIGAGTVTVKSLADAGSIELNNSTFTFAGTTATTYNTRFFNLTGTTTGGTINNSSTVPLTITPNLSVTGSGAKTLNFSGTYTGTSTFGGKITDSALGATSISFGGSGTWFLSNTASDYTGASTMNGIAAITSIADYGNPCSLGKGTLGTAIQIGGNNSTPPTLIYLGAGGTTDRQFKFGYGGNSSGGTFYNNGTGALTFTATPAWNISAGGTGFNQPIGMGGTFSGGVNEIVGGIVMNGTSGTGGVVKAADASIWKISGACTYSGTTTVNGGSFILNGNTGSLIGTSPYSALTLGGSASFIYDNTSSTGAKSQNMGALTLGGGENTIQSTKGGATSATLTFASVNARPAGVAANFVSGGVTDTTNKIIFTTAPTASQMIDKGVFFNGADYAAYDSSGYVRAMNYGGGDANTVTVDSITASKHVKLTGSWTPANQNTITLLSLNLSAGGLSWTQNASQTLTVPTILKAGGGSASTISGGTAVTGGTNTELVIRTDTASDMLAINIPLTQGSGGLTKSGAGTLILSSAATYTGATSVDAGTLLFNAVNTGASAVTVQVGATLGGSGTIPGAVTIKSGGTLQPSISGSTNTLTLSSATAPTFNTGSILKVRAPSSTMDKVSIAATTLNITGRSLIIDTTGLTGNVPSTDIVLLTGASPVITGQFGSVTLTGNTTYTATLDYSSAGHIKLALAPIGTPYSNWTKDPTFLGTLTDTNPSHDPDGGGLSTGIEWVVKGDPTTPADDASGTPTFDTTSDINYFIFTYRRSAAANSDPNTSIKVEYGSDLSNWTPASGDGTQTIITTTPDGGGSGVDLVHVKIKRSLATDGKLFARLNVVVTP